MEMNPFKEKVWKVLTNSAFIKQWDAIPENYSGGHLKLGSSIEWGGYSKLTVTEFDTCNKLRLKMFLPEVELFLLAYGVSYFYSLARVGAGSETKIKELAED